MESMPGLPELNYNYNNQQALINRFQSIVWKKMPGSKNAGGRMKRAALVFSIIFTVLTIVGAGYVLYNGGRVNAGYAVIPMIFTLVSIAFFRKSKS